MTNLVHELLTSVYFRLLPPGLKGSGHDKPNKEDQKLDNLFEEISKQNSLISMNSMIHLCVNVQGSAPLLLHLWWREDYFCPRQRHLNLCVICLQITELLDDERCEAECEELPQDGEEAPSSLDSPQHTETDDSPATR